MNRIDLKHLASNDEDFALWSAEQAALIRAGRLDRVDLENVAEEIESLGRSEEYQIDRRLEVLIQHLLKWQFQPQRRSNSWKASIAEQRIRIARVLRRSPSLKSYPIGSLEGSFRIGLAEAIRETGLPEDAFPLACPYTAQQVLDPDFWPGGAELAPPTERRTRQAKP
ncbi:MAG TPA: DUF29 domain-containing protein [Alphaproteobacteria bacterium]|nr:DUF29 domain-containing protein [Alphaproteobacteria bacterium]